MIGTIFARACKGGAELRPLLVAFAERLVKFALVDVAKVRMLLKDDAEGLPVIAEDEPRELGVI